jgi:hypothetical protein
MAQVATWIGCLRIHLTRYVLKGKQFAKTTTLHTTINQPTEIINKLLATMNLGHNQQSTSKSLM